MADSVRLRVRMDRNFEIDPMLNTFDLLDLQEMSMRIRHLNSRKRMKQKRQLGSEKVRRGGKQTQRQKEDLYYQTMKPVVINKALA